MPKTKEELKEIERKRKIVAAVKLIETAANMLCVAMNNLKSL